MSEFFHISFDWALLFQQFVLLASNTALIIGMGIWFLKEKHKLMNTEKNKRRKS